MTQNLTSCTYVPWPFSSPLAMPRSTRLSLSSFFLFFFFLSFLFLPFYLYFILFFISSLPPFPPVSYLVFHSPLLPLSTVSFSLSRTSPTFPASRSSPPPPPSPPTLFCIIFLSSVSPQPSASLTYCCSSLSRKCTYHGNMWFHSYFCRRSLFPA